jgi:flagellar protein FlgJ
VTTRVALTFQTQLQQQMIAMLDRTTLSMDEGETSSCLSPTTWDQFLALAQQTIPTRSATDAQAASGARPLGATPAKPALVIRHEMTPAKPIQPMQAAKLTQRSDAEGFLEKLAGSAQATAASLGLSPHLLLAQAALETGWGRKAIKALTGQESYNLFGIKAGKQWSGDTVAITTTEYTNGVPQKKVDTFRAYGSYAESFADYAKLLKQRYGDAIASGATAEGFGKALQAKGYATDPNYAQKIARVAQCVIDRMGAMPTVAAAIV